MRFAKIIVLTLATLVAPGYTQVIDGATALGLGLAGLPVAAFAVLHLSTSLELAFASLAAIMVCPIVSAVIFLRKRSVVLSKGKAAGIFIGMVLVTGFLSSWGPEQRGFTNLSSAMLPSINKEEVVYTRKIDARSVKRGDIIVFKKPPENKVDFIKRVVGLPGDRIQVKGGILHINGTPIQRQQIDDFVARDKTGDVVRAPQYIEPFPEGDRHRITEFLGDSGPYDNTSEYNVPKEHLFVMGDNRDNSMDSRFLYEMGYIPFENVEYIALWVVRPFPRYIDRF